MLTLLLIGWAGVLVHIIVKFRNECTVKKGETVKAVWTSFDKSYQLLNSLVGIILISVIVYFRTEIIKLFGIKVPEEMIKLVIFILGYFVDSVWKNIEGSAKNYVKLKE